MERVDITEHLSSIPKPDFKGSSSVNTTINNKKDIDQLWKIMKEQLRLVIGDISASSWYKGVFLESFENGIAQISVDNSYRRDWIESNHQNILKDLFEKASGVRPQIKLVLRQAAEEVKQDNKYIYHDPTQNSEQGNLFSQNIPATASQPSAITQSYDSGLNPNYKITNFIVGANSQLAYAAVQSVIDTPGVAYNPLFFYGPSGVGKTHLMQAVGNALMERDPRYKVLYVPIETFMNEMIEGIRTQKNEEVRRKYRSVDLLIIDDIQFISTYTKTKEELFNTFNALYQSNKQIIIASDRPPKEIENLPDRLKTRFEGGMVVDIHAPDYETRIAILRQRVIDRGVEVDNEIINFIAEKIEGSVRELEGAINKVTSHVKFLGKPLSMEDVAKMLQLDLDTKRRRITPDKIIDSICEVFDLTVRDIRGKRRTAYIAQARQVVMYLLREELEYPLEKVAAEVNRKDHTTVIHACEKIEGMIEKDERFAEKINRCKEIYRV